MAEWTFDPLKHQYRSGKRVLSEREMLDVRNAIADGMTKESASLASQLLDGIITLAQWTKDFAKLRANGIASAFMFGLGGKAKMDETATATLSSLIADQHDYAKAFVTDLATALDAGTATEEGVAARSALYSGASIEAFHQGQSQDWGVELPFFPSDGETPCGGNCRCSWEITDYDDRIEAVWLAQDDSKVCDGCQERADQYGPESPFVQSKDA